MIKPLAEQYQDKEKSAKEFVFIHANGKILARFKVHRKRNGEAARGR
jgi:hypothetical protein